MDNKMLIEISKHHKEWVYIVQSFGENLYAEDIVQEMYLRIDKYSSKSKVFTKKQLNKGYIYFVLRNLFLNYRQIKSRIDIVNIDECIDISHDIQLDFENRVEDEINKFHYYDNQLFNLYIDSGMSMRTIAKETGISTRSIFSTIKKCKEKLNKYEK